MPPSDRTIGALPLRRSAFAPYGAVIAAGSGTARPANDGRALRHDQVLDLAHRTPAEAPRLALYEIAASLLPLRVDYLECHPLSVQLFLPMSAPRYLIVVAQPDPVGEPDPETLRAFVAGPEAGICYAPGTWHYPLVSLETPATFAMLMWEAGEAARDCNVRALDMPRVVCPGVAD